MFAQFIRNRKQSFGKGGDNRFVNYMVITAVVVGGFVGYIEGLPAYYRNNTERAVQEALNVDLYDTDVILSTSEKTVTQDIIDAIRDNMGEYLHGEPSVSVEQIDRHQKHQYTAQVEFEYTVTYPFQEEPTIKTVEWNKRTGE